MGTSRHAEPRHRARLRQAAAAVSCILPLLGTVGCAGATQGVETFYDSKLSLDNPIDWWHQLQGGAIAAQRPPPPGIDEPYPNLSRVPPRPTPIDPKTRQSLLTQLTAERDRTRQLNTQDPIVFAGAAPAGKPAAGTTAQATSPAATAASVAAAAATAAPDPDASSMTLEAVSAPPAPAVVTPTAIDPRPPAAFAPARAVAPAKPVAPVTTGTPAPAVPVASGPIPALPVTAPGLPVLAGLPISVAQPVIARPRAGTGFSFAAGSAVLPSPAEAALRALAARRAGSPIRVLAGGDARSSTQDAQASALPLALRRANAITAALIAAGVPAGAIRADGVALGREASVRLVD